MSVFSFTINNKELKKLEKRSKEIFKDAAKKGGIQFLNWANNGSPRESRKPPIRWGVLRGSSSAFFENEFIAMNHGNNSEATKIYNGPKNTLTWAWNTHYAARMHEHKGNWGKFTIQDGDAGNKWLEKHIFADKEALIKIIAQEIEKNL